MQTFPLRWTTTLASVGVLIAASGCSAETAGAKDARPADDANTITIGVIAPLAGQSALPEVRSGMEAVLHQVNQVQGGINGRELRYELCESDGTPEYVVTCANNFVSKGVPVVVEVSDLTAGSAAPILKSAAIPMFGAYPTGINTDTQAAPASFYMSGGAAMHAAATLQMLKETGAKRISLAVPASTQAQDYVENLLRPAIEALPAELDVQFTDPGAINSEVLAATALTSKPEVAGVISMPEADCTNFFRSLRSQGFDGPLIGGPCSEFIEELGEDATGALRLGRVWTTASKEYAPERTQQQLEAFEEAMAAVGAKSETKMYWATASFAGLMTLADIMSTMDGEVTAASLTATLQNLKDHETWLLPNATCDGQQWPGSPGACSRAELFLTVESGGGLKPIGGDFLEINLPSK